MRVIHCFSRGFLANGCYLWTFEGRRIPRFPLGQLVAYQSHTHQKSYRNSTAIKVSGGIGGRAHFHAGHRMTWNLYNNMYRIVITTFVAVVFCVASRVEGLPLFRKLPGNNN